MWSTEGKLWPFGRMMMDSQLQHSLVGQWALMQWPQVLSIDLMDRGSPVVLQGLSGDDDLTGIPFIVQAAR